MRRKNQLSILWRVTLWYAMFLMIIAIAVTSAIIVVSDKIIQITSKELLIHIVETAMEEIDYDEGEIELDEDLQLDEKNAYLAVYNMSGEMIAGALPRKFETEVSLSINKIQTVSVRNHDWYLYDSEQYLEDYGKVILRGIMPVDTSISNYRLMLYVLLAFLPVVILIAICGGYLITKRAFRPLYQIMEAVEQINYASDLTKRIQLGEGKNEIYRLGKTFDSMFERLEGAFQREKQFTDDVSHELRTPITVILSQCEYAMEHENENPEETNKSLQAIYKYTKKMHRMMEQLLLMSRSNQGEKSLMMEPFDLSELIEVIVEESKERAEEKDITIESMIEPNIMINGNETLLMRLMVNLINNAMKYGRRNGWIRVKLYQEDSTILGSVEDNGIGIKAEEQEKIWQRFYQVNPARTSNEEGSMGLGLSMVLWIVEAHGGTIRVESEFGKGSRFIFELPMSVRNN